MSELTGTRARGSTERRGQNLYHISYQPSIKGRHQLHIKVQAQHIRGSPFKVAAKSPVEKLGTPILTIRGVRGPWGTPILTIRGVKGPWGVAVDQRREVEICMCLDLVDRSSCHFAEHTWFRSCMHGLCGVAVDGEGIF